MYVLSSTYCVSSIQYYCTYDIIIPCTVSYVPYGMLWFVDASESLFLFLRPSSWQEDGSGQQKGDAHTV